MKFLDTKNSFSGEDRSLEIMKESFIMTTSEGMFILTRVDGSALFPSESSLISVFELHAVRIDRIINAQRAIMFLVFILIDFIVDKMTS